MMKILQTLAILVLFGITSGYSDSGNSQTIEKFFDASAISFIDVQTFGGNLTIVGEDRPDISLKAEKIVRHASDAQAEEILREIDTEMDTRKDGLYISFEYEKNHSGRNFRFFGFGRRSPSVSVDIEIRAPKTVAQHLKTSGGNIVVKNLRSTVRVRTSGGKMKFHDISGSLEGKTSGGSIEASSIKGDMALSTSGGSIDLDTINGTIDVKTSGGSIALRNILGPTQARTSGGSIKAYFTEGMSNDVSLYTSGGSIKVYLPSDEAFHLIAKTSAGSLKTDFPIFVTGKFITHKAIGDVNGGGPKLQLHTSAGSIKVKTL